MAETLPCLEIDPSKTPAASVIWMHGLGADGHDFEPVVRQLNRALAQPLRFVLPHAPSMPVTVNMSMRMPAWYDMLDLNTPRNVDWNTVEQSRDRIERLIRAELDRGFEARKILLAGFSQGGAMALNVGLRSGLPLGGIVVLSSYFLIENPGETLSETATSIPVFMAHGKHDPLIPIAVGHASRDELASRGILVEWKEYIMPHSVCPDEIRDIGVWLERALAEK